jgi:hypothetical protein
MKNILIFFLVILSFYDLKPYSILNEKRILIFRSEKDPVQYIKVKDLLETDDGYIIAGTFYRFLITRSQKSFVLKTNKSFELIWKDTIDNPDYLIDVNDVFLSNNQIELFTTIRKITDTNQMSICKYIYNDKGQKIFEKCNLDSNDFNNSNLKIFKRNDSTKCVTLIEGSFLSDNFKPKIIDIDSSGNYGPQESLKIMQPFFSFGKVNIYNILFKADTTILCCNYKWGIIGKSEIIIYKNDSILEKNESGYDKCDMNYYSSMINKRGNYLIWGSGRHSQTKKFLTSIEEYNLENNDMEAIIKNPENMFIYDLYEKDEGGYTAVGTRYGSNDSIYYAFLILDLDTNLYIKKAMSWKDDNSSFNELQKVSKTSDNYFIVCGRQFNDIYLAKIDHFTGFQQNYFNIPKSNLLPNPSN